MIKYFDILKQYVNTGKPIPEYQLQKVMGMPKGLAKSYFRARINVINAGMYDFESYEVSKFEKLKPEIQAEFISKLNRFSFIEYAQNPDVLARIIIDLKGNTLDSSDIITLLEYSKNPDELAIMIINIKGNTLDSYDIEKLVKLVKNPDELAKIIIKVKGDKLDQRSMYMLLYYTKNRDEIIDRIIGIKNNTLDVFEILNLLIYSSNLNTVIKKLLEKGYSKSEINQAIIRYNQYGRKIDYIS